MTEARLILYHKQSTSARMRFLRLSHGGICGPALPAGAELAGCSASRTLMIHPASLTRAAEDRLRLPRGSIEADGGFRLGVSVNGESCDVFLARFTDIDPPFAAADAAGDAFIELTDARGLPPVELALLRQVYEHVLG